jgi:hypothetical protein
VYLPKVRQINIDGAYFGTSFPHVFLQHYPMAVILPPKIYYYEPKIFGFKMAGKRGSKYFEPPTGHVRHNVESMQGVEVELLNESMKKVSVSKVAAAPVEDQETQVEGGNNR